MLLTHERAIREALEVVRRNRCSIGQHFQCEHRLNSPIRDMLACACGAPCTYTLPEWVVSFVCGACADEDVAVLEASDRTNGR